MRTLLLVPLAVAAACQDGAADTASQEPPADGTLALRFAIEPDLGDAVAGAGPARFVGGVYWPEDVELSGLAEGAVALETLDLTVTLDASGAPTEVVHTTGPLPAETLYVLGFVDLDASDPAWPDGGDPVTLPGGAGNKHAVAPGAETEATVLFDLVMG